MSHLISFPVRLAAGKLAYLAYQGQATRLTMQMTTVVAVNQRFAPARVLKAEAPSTAEREGKMNAVNLLRICIGKQRCRGSSVCAKPVEKE